VKDGQLAVATVMTVTLTCDHRVVDGATGARFLQVFKPLIEDPVAMLAEGSREVMASVYDFSARAIDGADVSLDRFRGQALLIVNTASKCGFTGQYAGLEKLHRDLIDAPFEVLGFPCNQFGQQEPGRATEIVAFCASSFDVTFPLFDKVEVNGPA